MGLYAVRAFTISLLIGIAAAAAAATAAAMPPPEFPKTVTTSPADAAERYAALVERFQPAQGRDAGGVNAWAMLVDAAAVVREVDGRVWRDPAAGVTDTYPDFALIYDAPAAPTEKDKRNLALSLKLLGEYRGAGVFEKLVAIPATHRAARARIDSAEYRRVIGALGTPAGETWDGRLISVMLPELGSTRALARVNTARMHQAALTKNTPEYLAAFEQSLALARVSVHQPGTIDRLGGCAVAALAVDRAAKAVRAGGGGWTDPALLDALLAALDRQTKWPSLRLPIEGERLLVLDICRWAFDADGRPDPRLFSMVASMRGRSLDLAKFSGVLATRDETVAAANGLFDLLVKAHVAPASRREAAIAEVDAFVAALPPGQLVVPMVAPAYGKMLEADARTAARIAVLRVTLALEKHKIGAGGYPASLAGLRPPVAFNDPWNDRPLRYTKTATGYDLSSAEADGR